MANGQPTTSNEPLADQQLVPTAPASLLLPGEARRPANRTQAAGRHKRSLSGSILSSLNLLRSTPPSTSASASASGAIKPLESSLATPSTSPPHTNNDRDGLRSDPGQEPGSHSVAAPTSPHHSLMSDSAVAISQRAAKQRKRKGSLRKTALLGTGRLAVRERRNSLLLQRAKPAEEQSLLHSVDAPPPSPISLSSLLPHVQRASEPQVPFKDLTYQSPMPATSSHAPATLASPLQPSLSLDTERRTSPSTHPAASDTAAPSTSASPVISPTSQSYNSTTDDDEALTLPNSLLKRPPMPGSGSYFPAQPSIQRRRSSKKPPSPLSAIPVNAYGTDEEYDYSETEWWGWVVLIVTWIVFVVGMGSCFGLWSWAWDVGETPYAPPELEDDPTLPIVGYYPALIILTGVMAWVWVVVAWVGMKYFKHAKMAGEDV